MGLETATFINGLDATNPTSGDPKSQGDDHLRLIKAAIKATFPNITGAVTATHSALSTVGVTQPLTSNDTSVASTAYVQNALLASTGVTAQLPAQAGNAGNFLTTNGTAASWAQVLPTQSGNSGKYLTTNGTSTSWGTPGLNGAQTLSTSTTLTSTSPVVNLLAPTAIGMAVTMPNATTLTVGAFEYVLDNAVGKFPVGVLNNAGQVMGQVLPGDTVAFHCVDNSSAAGQWRHIGNLDPVWINNEVMLSLTRPTAEATMFAIDSTRCLITWRRSGDNFPLGRVVTWSSPSATPTVGAETVLKAANTGINDVYALGSGRALIWFGDNTVAVLDTSTSGVGTAQSVTFTAGTLSRIQVLDSQYAVAAAIDSTGTVVRAKCLDAGASGTTLTVGAEAVSAAFTGTSGASWMSNGGVQLVSSTVVGLTGYGNNGTSILFWAYALTRTSGTTLSFSANAGNPTGARTGDTTPNFELHPLSASTALLWYWTNTVVNYAVITFASGSATWGTAVASNVRTSTAHAGAFAASMDRTRFVAAQCIANSTCNIEAITVSGNVVTVGVSTSFSSETAAGSPSIQTLAVTNEGRGLIFWRGQAYSSSSTDKIRLFTLSGTTFTFGAEASSTYSGFLGSIPGQVSVADLQVGSGNNTFRINANQSGTSVAQSRNIIFRVSASATMDVLAEIDANESSLSFTPRAETTDAVLLTQTAPTGSRAERILVNANSRRVIRAQVPLRKLAAQMGNGATSWSNQQRATGLGILAPYTLPGSNAILQTHRLAEV